MLNDNLGNPRLRMAVRLALTGGSLAATVGVANAQTAPAVAANSDATLQEVVVTGSRISVPNQVSISPVTFVSALDVAQTAGDASRGFAELRFRKSSPRKARIYPTVRPERPRSTCAAWAPSEPWCWSTVCA